MQPSRIAMAVALVTLLGGGAAWAETLDIKTGLWETTTTMTMTGMPGTAMQGPEPDYSKLPPESREKMKAMRKAARGEPRTETERSCITQETLDKDQFDDHDNSCTRTVVEKTKTLVHLKLLCASPAGKGEGEFRYEAVSREQLKGAFTMVTTPAKPGATPIHMKSEMAGRWLSAECGALKDSD